MRFEPLLYFAALLDSKGEIIKFAECDINTNLPFSAIYCFNEIIENSYFIDTIWYDCYLKEYSHCRLRLNDYNINNQIIKILISQASEDKLFIVSTHEIKEIDKIIDGFYVLKNGKLSEFFNAEDIVEQTGLSIEEFYKEQVNEKE